MPRDENIITIRGHAGRDAELKATQSGSSVAQFSIATSYNRKVGDEWEKETTWHTCVAFGKVAEIADQIVRKGDRYYVKGRIQERKWTNRDGNEKKRTEVVVNELEQLVKHPHPTDERSTGNDDDVPF